VDTARLAVLLALARARGQFLFTILAAPAGRGAGAAAAPRSGTRSRRALAGGRCRRFRFALCAVGSGMELARSGRPLMRRPPGAGGAGGASYGVGLARAPFVVNAATHLQSLSL
jgi:hypothetical protein